MKNKIVNYVDLLGKSFKYGACGPDSYDCKGLLMELFKRRGMFFPYYESSPDPAIQSQRFVEGLAQYACPIDKPEAGCLVMFRVVPHCVSHIGMMLDELNFIHITKGTRVSVERIDSLVWQNKIAGYYKVNI